MKLLIYFSVIIWAVNVIAQPALSPNGGNIHVKPGALLYVAGDVSALQTSTIQNDGEVVSTGNISNQIGTFQVLGSGKLILQGLASQSLINLGSQLWVEKLEINKPAGNTLLSGGMLHIGHSLHLTSGSLDLQGEGIVLDADALLAGEIAGRRVFDSFGGGYLTGTLNVNAPSGLNLLGLGIEATDAQDWGSTTVTRWHDVTVVGPYQSIARKYRIEPSNNSGLNVSLRFHYLDPDETNGQMESSFRVWKSSDNSTWAQLSSTPNTSSNYVEATGITSFSWFTVSDNLNPLPVTWLSFEGKPVGREAVQLDWTTNHWREADYFEVQHSTDGVNFLRIGEKKAVYTEKPAYQWIHASAAQGWNYYRLKQVDRGGAYAFSNVIAVRMQEAIFHISPQPIAKGETVFFSEEAFGFELYDLSGKRCLTAEKPGQRLQLPILPTGYYFYRLRLADGSMHTGKILIE
jgi:hypothetical protein